MEKSLLLWKLVDGEAEAFPNEPNQIRLSSFSARKQRMGAVPSITATVKYKECLEGDDWNDVFVEFAGERYFVKSAPDTEKNNTDIRYEHSVTFVSERKALDEVYMVDAVRSDLPGDGYKTNDTRVIFSGNITQWKDRLNAALTYAGLGDVTVTPHTGYYAVVDEDVTTEDKMISFDEKFLSEALQEGFKAFGVPYYFVGKVIHLGFGSTAISTPVKYGSNDALIAIGRKNANIKTANRMSGYGSSENIPYYYPNETPIGNGVAASVTKGTGSTLSASIRSKERLSVCIPRFPLTYGDGAEGAAGYTGYFRAELDEKSGSNPVYFIGGHAVLTYDKGFVVEKETFVKASIGGVSWNDIFAVYYGKAVNYHNPETYGPSFDSVTSAEFYNVDTGISYDVLSGTIIPPGNYLVTLEAHITFETAPYSFSYSEYQMRGEFSLFANRGAWRDAAGNRVEPYDLGLTVSGTAVLGDKIDLARGSWIEPLSRLMPPIYRESGGSERFYNAENHSTSDPDSGYPIPGTDPVEYYHFDHEYSANDRRELIQEFEDIKPTITGITNGDATPKRIDKFLAVAFDEKDSDEKDEDGNYAHPYFFVKLAKTNGLYGFNLFDCALDTPMQVAMTSGVCGSCKFEIGVDSDSMRNTVQVDDNGNLMRDDNGDVVCGREGKPKVPFIERQQNTRNYEVWIALKKDNNTYPSIMPSRTQALFPSTDDTFVLANINMPQAYITAAEDRLEDAIIRQMSIVNSPIFNPSITFSRVFLEQNPTFLSSLSENARLTNIVYNSIRYGYYISQLTYTMSEGEILPEISVDLVSELTTSSSVLETRLDAVKQDIFQAISGQGETLESLTPFFLRKDIADAVKEITGFRKGLTVGEYSAGTLGAGAMIGIKQGGGTFFEVDDLMVRRTASFSELVIDREKAINGGLVVSPAGLVIENVEAVSGGYKCYFKDNDGSKFTINPFTEGALARCQTFNPVKSKYYWRKVTSVGQNYIILSDVEDEYEGTDIPEAGDSIVQIGHATDADLQSAIMLSSYGTNSPSIKMYHGIDSFDLAGKDMFGVEYDATKHEPYFFNYGSMRLGARPTETDGSYITYDRETGALNIKAVVNILPGSIGIPDDLGYLKDALNESTAISGGLILTSLIELGYTSGGQRTIMSGISGLGSDIHAIAAWYGGDMTDLFSYNSTDGRYYRRSPVPEGAATSLFRFDGTGYLAKGNIVWDEDGNGWVGGTGEGNSYAVKWENGSVYLGNGIKIGASDETITTILNAINQFKGFFTEETYTDSEGVSRKRLKVNGTYAGLYTDGFLSAGGIGSGGGGGGGGDITLTLGSVTKQGSVISFTSAEMKTSLGSVATGWDNSISSLGTRVTALENRPQGGVTSVAGLTGAIAKADLQTALELGSLAYKSSLDASDIPSLAASKITSGTFAAARIPSLSWSKITSGKPTTLLGYGITDAHITNGVITLGSASITPITTSNIGSQSVAYATSAGSVAWTNVTNHPTSLSQFTDDILSGHYLPLSGGTITGGLTVSSTLRANGNVLIPNAGVLACVNADGTKNCTAVTLTTSNVMSFGYGARINGYATQVEGNGISFITQTSGNTKAVITPSGNFGIGTDSPSYILDVSGDIHTDASLRIGNIELKEENNLLHIVGGMYADGQVSAGGIGSGGGGTGGIVSIYLDGARQPETSGRVDLNLSNYALKTFVTGQGYITSAALSGYATRSWVRSNGTEVPQTSKVGLPGEIYVSKPLGARSGSVYICAGETTTMGSYAWIKVPEKKADITTLLGFTPYDATNPSGYTSNTGTVTSVAVKINGWTKGTVTTSGTIDLGSGYTQTLSLASAPTTVTEGIPGNLYVMNPTSGQARLFLCLAQTGQYTYRWAEIPFINVIG